MKKRGFDQPEAIHEQWHIDFSYIKIAGAFYYFLGILDGYSRKMLNWRLCENMGGMNAETCSPDKGAVSRSGKRADNQRQRQPVYLQRF